MIARVLALGALLVACSSSGKSQRPSAPAGKKITVFMTTELKGSIEPCGCTSDPLGDLARTAKLIADARAGGGTVLYIDGGSMLYADPSLAESLIPQERLKSALLVQQMADTLKPDAIGIGPFDLALGKDLGAPRHAVNLANSPGAAELPLAEPRIISAGGINVGVFGVVSSAAVSSFGLKPSDPIKAASETAAKLRADGADVVIAILHMIRSDAATLTRQAKGIDFALVGENAPEPDAVSEDPIEAGHSWLIEPANRGQIVSRLEITVRPGGTGFSDALGEARAQRELEALPEAIGALEAELSKWASDPNADKAFIAGKERELAAMRAKKKKLETSPIDVPAAGSYFTFDQVRIAKALACAPSVVTAKQGYDRAAGAANVAALGQTKPTAPAAGKASYVGVEECGMCHGKAVKLWETTKHFEAWETLEEVGKSLDLSCIYCHVSGFDEPGGANIAFNEHLRDVQCETCHGPGSLHVEADGKGHIELSPKKTLCEGCHNSEHSDTFAFEPYLRDVTGPGHAEEFRKTLGDGPTGKELRAAALAKAGSAIGAGCPK